MVEWRVPPGEDPGWSRLHPQCNRVREGRRNGGSCSKALEITRKECQHIDCVRTPCCAYSALPPLCKGGWEENQRPDRLRLSQATGSWKSCACPSAALSQHGDQARDGGAYAEHLNFCQRTTRRSPATNLLANLCLQEYTPDHI